MQVEPERYQCHWKKDPDAPADSNKRVHYWVDLTPEEPHWPPSAVMRWDQRPNDWHKIWPELIDHPCALLFAPKHPHREGPPRFKDWVLSWPPGYDWASDLPAERHALIQQTLDEIANDKNGSKDSPMAEEQLVRELKSISIEQIENAFANALNELTGGDYKVRISKLDLGAGTNVFHQTAVELTLRDETPPVF